MASVFLLYLMEQVGLVKFVVVFKSQKLRNNLRIIGQSHGNNIGSKIEKNNMKKLKNNKLRPN